jgi:hypothetical protein
MPDGRPFSASVFSVRFPPDALVNVAHQQAPQSLRSLSVDQGTRRLVP